MVRIKKNWNENRIQYMKKDLIVKLKRFIN